MAAAIIRNKGAGTVYKKNKDTAAAHWRKTPGMLKFTPVKIQPQAKVQFRQKQSIDKIVIHATNLYGFETHRQDDTQSWQLLTSIHQTRKNQKSPIVLRIHTVTKAILLQAKYQKPFHTRKLMEISPQFEN